MLGNRGELLNLANDPKKKDAKVPSNNAQSKYEAENNIIYHSKSQENYNQEETKEKINLETRPIMTDSSLKSPAMQGLENNTENSFICAILHCFGHFDELRKIASHNSQGSKLLNVFKSLVNKIQTKEYIEADLKQFELLLYGENNYRHQDKIPKDIFPFIIGKLRERFPLEVQNACIINKKNIHTHNQCEYTMAWIQGGANWADDLKTFLSHGSSIILNYPPVLCAYFVNEVEIQLRTEITISKYIQEDSTLRNIKYRAEAIISRRDDLVWWVTIYEGESIVQYMNKTPRITDSLACKANIVFFRLI